MTNLKYGMTRDTLQVQERMSRFNPGFIPWQPNGSGSGKILEMMVKSVYFEDGDTAVLMGGIPWQWIEAQGLSLKGLYLPHGRVSIEATRGKNGQVNVTLDFDAAPSHLGKIRLPEHFQVTSKLRSLGGNLFALPRDASRITFTLCDAEGIPRGKASKSSKK